ncbi:MAG: response regulator [Dehalococcoidia bacterium]
MDSSQGPAHPNSNRILLINREPLVSRFVQSALQSAWHEVLSARNAEDALTLMEQERPHLILIDLWLSGLFDTGLLRQLASLGGPRIVVLSDPPTQDESTQALEAGADDYIPLPIAADELLQRVQAALSVKPA